MSYFSSLHREAKLILAATGLIAVSFFGIQTLLGPLYVLRLGHGAQYVGYYSAAGAFTYMAMALPSGALGSWLGPRKVMRIGGAWVGASMALLPLTEIVPASLRDFWPLIFQGIFTIGWSMFDVNLAPGLMSVASFEERHHVLALNSVLRSAGTLAGTLVGGFLPPAFAGLLGMPDSASQPYSLSLLVATVVAIGAAVPLFWLRTSERPTGSEAEEGNGAPFPLARVATSVGHAFLMNGAGASVAAFCNVYMDTTLGLASSAIGGITGLGQVAAVAAPMLGPRLARRHRGDWVLTAMAACQAVSLIPLALVRNWAAAGVGRLGVLATSALWLPALQLYLAEQVPARWRSLAFGAISMAFGLSFASVSLVGGYIAQAYSYNQVFLLGAGLAGGGALLLATARRAMARAQRSALPAKADRLY